VRLRITWEGSDLTVDAPASATVGSLRRSLPGDPTEVWIGDRRFTDGELVGRIPNGAAVASGCSEERDVPVVSTGRLDVHRPPRVLPRNERPAPRRPEPPPKPDRTVRFRWAAAAVPLLAGGVLAILYGPMMAAFSLLGVLMAVGSWIEDLIARKRERRAFTEAVRRGTALHHRSLIEWQKEIADGRSASMPGPERLVRIAASRDPALWQRRSEHADFGLVSVATTNDGVPVGIMLRPDVTLGVSGPAAIEVAHWVLAQVAAHHGPSDVTIRSVDATYDWVDWLPHCEGRHRIELVVGGKAPAGGWGLVTSSRAGLLPGTCAVVVETDDDGSARIIEMASGESTRGRAITMSRADAVGVARTLACLRDPDETATGESRSLRALLGSAGSVVDVWRSRGTSLSAPIGTAGADVLELDLIEHGPHALIAGTTGSGKSELLRTLVVSLAFRYPPRRVAFVLVDFKGGSTFDPCKALPHVAGMVTDLDATEAGRMLDALEAEVRAREQQLRTAGVSSLEPEDQRLPRLVVIVDEFAALADQAPAALEGLVDLAQRGRSLGIHLILATQRPAGVVSSRIRANTSIRIALRVHDDADSQDVVGVKKAALISRHTPGHGFARLGPNELVEFETAFVSGISGEISVRPTGTRTEVGEAGPTDLDLLVQTICRAAIDLEEDHVVPVWGPPLPDIVRRDDLDDTEDVPIGLVDDPREPSQLVWTYDNVLLVDPGGKDAVRALAGIVSSVLLEGTQVHAIGVGAESPLWDLEASIANVVAAGQEERTGRVLRYIAEEIVRRRLTRQTESPIVLAVESGVGSERLQWVIEEGPRVGVYSVVAIPHVGAIGGSLLAAFRERFAFRFVDPYEYLALGMSSAPELPLRAAFSLVHQRVVRIVEPGGGISVKRIGPHIGELPACVPLSTIEGRAVVMDGTLTVPIGLGGTSVVEQVGIRLEPGRHVVITGPPGAGKTTALRAIEAALRGLDEGSEAVRRSIVAIDDADSVEPPEIRPDDHLIVAARTGQIPHGHWVRRLAADAEGVCLRPDHRDEDLWRMRLPTASLPGRGVLICREGGVVPIQVASGTMQPQPKEDTCECG